MQSLSGFKLALIGMVLFIGLSVIGLFLYKYLNNPDPTQEARESQAHAQSVVQTKSTIPDAPFPQVPAIGSSGNNSGNSTTTNEVPPIGGVISTPNPTIPKDAGVPPIEAPPEQSHGGLVNQSAPLEQNPYGTSPVPNSLLNQQPPGFNESQGSSTITTKTEITPDRYLFNNLTASATNGGKVILKGSSGSDINIKTFAPPGEDIQAVFMDNVSSNNFEVSVNAAVWYDFYFQRHLLFPVGTKLLGLAAKGKFRNRINVTFTRAVFKDGRSIGINAIGTDTDGTVGVPGDIIGNVLLDSIGPILLQAVQAAADRLKERETDTFSSYSNGSFGSSQTISNDQIEKDNLANAGLDAATSILGEVNDLISQDLEENKPYVLVPAGTRCRVRLTTGIDTSLADYEK